MMIHHIIWIRPGSVDCSNHLGWISTGSGGYGDLGIRRKNTNISVDVNIFYDVKSTSCFMGSIPGSG